jgi:5,10-methylenetetrahydromethanopterin reductase
VNATVTEIWNTEMTADVEEFLANAVRAEAEGWDGICVTDTQNRSPEAFVMLAAAAARTSRIGLGTGVSNPLTRHPALMASGAAGLQRLSRGRLVLAIGRGDSAAAHIGAGPARLGDFARYLRSLRAYLVGEDVSLDEAYEYVRGLAPRVDSLHLKSNPDSSSLGWLGDQDLPVPLEVVGSGTKVLALAATLSETPAFAVGASPERVDWALSTIRAARVAAGLGPVTRVTAYVNVVAHPDPAVARRLVRAVLPSTSRFSVMQGHPAGPFDEESREVLEEIRSQYSMSAHGTAWSSVSTALTEKFAEANGIAGTAEHCVARLRELTDLGVGKIVVFPVGRKNGPEEVERARVELARSVVPHFARSGAAV